MNRKRAICYVVMMAIPVVFLLILLAIFCLPVMFLALLLLIAALGILKQRRPAFFEALKKRDETMPPLTPRTTDPIKHANVKKSYMMLIGLNSPNLQITVDDVVFTIGRARACNFVLDDPMVSRRHLSIEYNDADKTCYIIDHSANGTFLNSERLRKEMRCALKQGDNLQIASTIFTVEYAHY